MTDTENLDNTADSGLLQPRLVRHCIVGDHCDVRGHYICDAIAKSEFYCDLRKKWLPCCGRHAGAFKRRKRKIEIRPLPNSDYPDQLSR